jgi:hypothetical protein
MERRTTTTHPSLLDQTWFWGMFGFWAGLGAYLYLFVNH